MENPYRMPPSWSTLAPSCLAEFWVKRTWAPSLLATRPMTARGVSGSMRCARPHLGITTKDLTAWPRPATTDVEGRFTLRGVGRGTQVYLDFDDPRFARQRIDIDTDTLSDSKPLRMVLQPAQIVSGRVTYADNGKPVPHAWVSVSSSSETQRGTHYWDFQADAEGRFRADPFPGDRLFVVAHSPDRQPYLSVRKTFDWPKGAIEHAVDLALPRGVSIRGKVTEEGSGQPIAGAAVRYSVYTKLDANPDNWASPAETSADGSFEFAVAPQPGYLAIGAPSEDYVTQEIGDRLLFEGQPGGRRMYAHAFNVCDPKSDTGGLAFNVVLHRGAFIKGRVVGPDGQPVHDAWMFSRLSSDGRLRLGDPGVPGSTAARATASSSCTESTPAHALSSTSSSRNGSSEQQSIYRGSRRAVRRLRCGSSPAARPKRDSSVATENRSQCVCRLRSSRWLSPRARSSVPCNPIRANGSPTRPR